MDLASLILPPTRRDAAPVRYSLRGRLGASMLARASRRQAGSPTAQLAQALSGAPVSRLAPRSGAFDAATAAVAGGWKAT